MMCGVASSMTMFNDGYTTAMAEARANAIPRYAEPAWAERSEPEGGCCYNCNHMVTITLDGRFCCLCAQERDDGKPFGEVYECDPQETGCADWAWDGNEL